MLKITVVTISYNQADFLEACINSVLNQNYPNLEYIIVDPGSTDGSKDIIRKHSDKFSCIIFEQDNGPADGLNKGFSKATGDIFYFINSDDIVLPDAFQIASEYFSRDQKLDILTGNGIEIDEYGNQTRKIRIDKFRSKSYVYGASIIFQQGIFFRKRAFKQIGGFNLKNNLSWDAELLLDFKLNCLKFKKTNQYLGAIRSYGDTITYQIHNDQFFKAKYLLNRNRLFEKVMKRPKIKVDIYIRLFHFFNKFIMNPHNFRKLLNNRYKGIW